MQEMEELATYKLPFILDPHIIVIIILTVKAIVIQSHIHIQICSSGIRDATCVHSSIRRGPI